MSREAGDEESTVEREAVERQLEVLLAHPVLNHSKRHQQLLKYIVTQTLIGNTDSLKERTLGIDVFGRAPDYDTVRDPIVRVSAAALRKRLSAYYLNPESKGQVQITIPVGGYVAQFIWADSNSRHEDEKSDILVPQSESKVSQKSIRSFRYIAPIMLSIAALAIVIILAYKYRYHPFTPPDSALSIVWSPLVINGQPPLCVIGQPNTMSEGDVNMIRPPQTSKSEPDQELIRYDDANAFAKIVAQLQIEGVYCRTSKSSNVSLSGLRQGPDILIGAFNNAWTLRLVESLRFHFGNGSNIHDIWIEDKETGMRWKRRRATQNAASEIDYAIIARYRDTLTSEPTLVVAGLGSGGTVAAGQFITNPLYLEGLVKIIGLKAMARNFEAVIETELIDGEPGAPHIVSNCFWN